MRLLSLIRVAWDAEALYLRRSVKARAVQVELAAVAAVFALLLLLMLHLAAFAWLAETRSAAGAALLVAAGDLVVAVLLGLLAWRSGRDPVAQGALQVRDDALRQLGDGAARAAMLAPLLRAQTAKKGMLGAALTAMIVGLLSRR
ncbi:hypothetical protein [Roseomonas sp. AR75]|jgi:hypothetical protein|uniref:hypothetical protein n=1 Tax=Roseomonas sp. AR75 TaxID=2562311 RepID=UPI0010C0FFAC|nr:hypothetical protein [Roseomonas sp. AR75]